MNNESRAPAYHVIEAAPPPSRFARGWHCLGLTEIFRDGKPHKIDIFGTKLVVFQGESGGLHVLNAYCPHLGGDLSDGQIIGDTIACPFHDWRWAGDGSCAGIPYARKLPPRAKTKSWPTMEENDQLFVWNDPEGNPPIAEQIIPDLKERFPGTWSPWFWESVKIDTNCRELLDNVADVAHFFYVHGEGRAHWASYFKNIYEGHNATQIMEQLDPPPGMDYDRGGSFNGEIPDEPWTRSEATYHGPAYMIDYLWRNTGSEKWIAALINAHYPIDPNSFMLHVGLTVRSEDSRTPEENQQIADNVSKYFRDAFFQDVDIWKSKTRIDNPLLCDGDGPVYRLRRWYDQFYTDVADIHPGMTRLVEVESDLTEAKEIWKKQAEEKIRAESETD